MKKMIVGLLAVVLLFGAFTACNRSEAAPAAAETPAQAAAETPAQAAAPTPDAVSEAVTAAPEIRSLDYEAIRAIYPEDSVAITLETETADWGFYADFLRTNGLQYEQYFSEAAAYYGVALDWTGSAGTGMTYAQALVKETDETLSSFMAIHALAAEKGVTLDEEARKKLDPEQLALDICGEGGTVEQLREMLEQESHMTLECYNYYSETLLLYSALYQELYGVDGDKLSEEQVLDALEADGYLSAGHILFMTIDPMTGKELDADAVAEKRAQAEAVAQELRAIEDPEELVRRFAELKAQYCEDTGKEVYPDGYTFTPGTMVSEFEAAVKSMGSYDVSEPVQTAYGLHVIMRLPLSADSILTDSQSQPISARKSVAQNGITKTLDAWYEAHPPVYAEGLEDLDLTKYIKE